MAKSVLQEDETHCFFLEHKTEDDPNHPENTYQALDKHHVFGGPNRKHSEKYGLWVKICMCRCHRAYPPGGPTAVHSNPNHGKDLFLKQYAQRKFEELYSHEEFMRIFGKNYL